MPQQKQKRLGGTSRVQVIGGLGFLLGFAAGRMFSFEAIFAYRGDNNDGEGSMATIKTTLMTSDIHNSSFVKSEVIPPQVFNFIKELQCRPGHMDVPSILRENGAGKVVVDIGLDAGNEFFAALESGYSVYGFEANPISCIKLREQCEQATSYKCVYINADNITGPLPPIPNGGYLIEGGVGSKKGTMTMSLAGPGSSLVETAPGVATPQVSRTYFW